MEDIGQLARESFESGYFCAESVLLALARHFGIDNELVPKLATGFCAGVSRTSNMCGALTGGIMAIGLQLGRTSPNQSQLPCYEATQRLIELFEEKFGSYNCQTITGCDFRTDEGRAEFQKRELSENLCIPLTGDTPELVLRALEETSAER